MNYNEQFNFYGYPLEVKSNTRESLDYIRFLYRRFLVNGAPEKGQSSSHHSSNGKMQIEIRDYLKDSNRMTVSYGQYCSQVSITDKGYQVIHVGSQDIEDKILYFPSLYSFYQAIMISVIGHQIQKSHIFIHASAVSWKGRGIIFPAQPNGGKSTLSVHLLRQGFKFLSDEITCYNLIEQRLEAHPRSIRLRKSSNAFLDLDLKSSTFIEDTADDKWIVDIGDVVPDCDPIGDPCSLKFIFFLNGFAEKPSLKPIEQFQGLRMLLTSCFNPMDDGAYSFVWLSPMIRGSKCFELTMGPLNETTKILIKTCEKGSSSETG